MRLCLCADEKDEMASVDSDKFCSIINKVESLHQHGKCDCFCWLVETDFHDLGGDLNAYTGNHRVGEFNYYF